MREHAVDQLIDRPNPLHGLDDHLDAAGHRMIPFDEFTCTFGLATSVRAW